MGSFGDRLRREREQRGITLDDIALTTKIRAGLLQALEEEKFDRLPGGIFNKGFVRAYARHLGLDEDQTVADYLAASGEAPVRRPAEVGANKAEPAQPRIQLVREEVDEPAEGSHGIRGMVAGLVVLVVVGAVAWFYYHHERRPESPAEQAQAVPTEPSRSASANSPTNNTPSTTPAAASAAKGEKPPVSNTGVQQAASLAAVPSQSETPAGMFSVRLKADEECWVQIVADGKSEEATLEAGLEKVISARNRVTVRAGSVGALNLYFNGTKLPSQGEYGQVKTLVFGPQGLESPARGEPGPASTVNP